MSALSHGMDIAQIEALGHRLQNDLAARVTAVADQLEQLVGGTSSEWIGPDAEAFRSWWPNKRARLIAMAEDLHGFGQSALNNATEQRQASGGNSGSGSIPPGLLLRPGGDGEVPSMGDLRPPVTGSRTWQEARAAYDAWAAGRFAPGGVSHYQCTGWANFRWAELGYDGPAIDGHGGQMAANAPGETSLTPSQHAMASYRSGEYGHVMIVEEMSADGSRIRVSEMNVGYDANGRQYSDSFRANDIGHADEYRDNRWITRGSDGTFRAHNGNVIEFAAFPGG